MITKIDKFETYFNQALKGALAIILYFLFNKYAGAFLQILNIDTSALSKETIILYNVIIDLILILILIILYKKELKDDIKDIKINHKKYYGTCFKYWLISLAIMYISNLILIVTTKNIAANEQAIEDLFKVSPLYVYFAAVIYAPIVEEIIFRKSIRKIIPNKYLFIIISGLVFGLLHVISDINAWHDLFYIIPYSAPGIAFAYMYYKTDNIFTSMGFHFMHNGLLIALQFVILIFG